MSFPRWRLVPPEPTAEMIIAALTAMRDGAATRADWRDIWAAMLSAAPTPEGEGRAAHEGGGR